MRGPGFAGFLLTVVLLPSAHAQNGAHVPIPVQRAEAKLALKNVEINQRGFVPGRLLTPAGIGVNDRELKVLIDGKNYSIRSQDDGTFQIPLQNGGRCVLQCGDEAFAFRAWKFGTAPKGSLKSIAVVDGDTSTVRGNPLNSVGNRLSSLTTSQKVVLGLAVVAGSTVAIIESVDDGS